MEVKKQVCKWEKFKWSKHTCMSINSSIFAANLYFNIVTESKNWWTWAKRKVVVITEAVIAERAAALTLVIITVQNLEWNEYLSQIPEMTLSYEAKLIYLCMTRMNNSFLSDSGANLQFYSRIEKSTWPVIIRCWSLKRAWWAGSHMQFLFDQFVRDLTVVFFDNNLIEVGRERRRWIYMKE